jgi:hypothetical protein
MLLAIGFGLMAVAAPLSFMDTTGRSVAVVFALVGGILLRWSLRYQRPVGHALGMAAVIVGYQAFPSLVPFPVTEAVTSGLRVIGLSGTVPLSVLAHAGLVLLFLLALSKVPKPLRSTHALVAAGHAALVVSVALFDDVAAMIVVPIAILLALAGDRSRQSSLLTVGIGALSMGLHRHLAIDLNGSTTALVVLNMGLFAIGASIARLVASGRLPSAWKLGATLSMLAHGCLGLGWILFAIHSGHVGIEPTFLVLMGLAALDDAWRRGHEWEATGALGLLVLYVPFHLWALSLLTSWPVALLLVLLGLVGLRLTNRWPGSVAELTRLWQTCALAVVLAFPGLQALGLATALVLVRAADGGWPLRSLLLALLHLHVCLSAVTDPWFPVALLHAWASSFPVGGVLVMGWILLVDATRRTDLARWTLALEALSFFGLTASCMVPGRYGLVEYGLLLGVALVLAVRHGFCSVKSGSREHAWATEAWAATTVLVGYGAGFVDFGNGRAPYILLAVGVLQYALARLAFRRPDTEALARTSLVSGQILALAGGLLALARVLSHATTFSVWYQVLPLFLASLFYLVIASRERARRLPAALSAAFLGCGLLAVGIAQGVGGEFYALAPGFSLIALAALLSEELGPRLCRHVFTAGAAFIYATPMLALYDEITWGWQAVLLLMTLGFGSASFYLRSRPLLTVSTAALVIDLACFVIKVRATEPMLLWAGGLLLGASLMSFATFLEYRREGLTQRLRVYGRELSLWY